MIRRLVSISLALSACCFAVGDRTNVRASETTLGVFDGQTEVGNGSRGRLSYDAAKQTYTVRSSGESKGRDSDVFHFVWKKVSGDVSLSANIDFEDQGGKEQRNAVLMVRQSLDANSTYAGVTLRGNGQTSLQYRDEMSGTTREIGVNVSQPKRLRIEKRGDFVYVSLADQAGTMRFSGASIRVPLQGGFYVGIALCAQDKNVVGKAIFSDVHLATDLAKTENATLYSSLETIEIASTDRSLVFVAPERFEAPNWTRDNKTFLFNRDGRIYALPIEGGNPAMIDTGFADKCNNDHGISPDQTMLAISDQSQSDNKSTVYVVPIHGGVPRRVTQKSPSYWHGWSPDGKTLAFVGQRRVGEGNEDFDIYTISVNGGEETRLTTAKGLDDGPEYSPDGKYIYFNSERTGHMQIWRMRADGSEQEQVMSDEWNNWFPHISPDGRWMVFLSFEPGVVGHPPNKNVMLRMMSLPDKKVTVLAKLFGGQGTMNVPSWSPDGKKVAFVSYALVADVEAARK